MKLAQFAPTRHLIHPTGGCASCPRKLRDHVPATLKDTKLIFVGEAPGEEEVKNGEGFIGRSGQRLRTEAHQAGITQYSLTNVIKCRPPKNRNPTQKEQDCCMAQFTMQEVQGYPIVVLVGNTAIKAFFPGARGSKMRGNLCYHPDFPGQRFYSMYHPAAGMYDSNSNAAQMFTPQMRRLGKVLRGDREDDFEVLDHTGRDFLERLRGVLAVQRRISLDLETDRLKSWEKGGRVLSFALTWDGRQVLFSHEDDPWYREALRALVPYLSEEDRAVIGHHIGFDLDWLEQQLDFSVACRTVLDTGNLFYMAHGEKLPSLKYLTSKYLDGYRHMIYKPSESSDPDLLRLYNAEDVVYPWRLVEKGLGELQRTDEFSSHPDPAWRGRRVDLYMRVGGPSDLFLQRLTSAGIWFSVPDWEKARDHYRGKRQEAIEAWQEADPDFHPGVLDGDDSLRSYLYRTKGLPVVKETKGGKPSADKDTIKELIRTADATYLEHLLQISKVDKLLSTYIEEYAEKWVEGDGRVHADFLNSVTDTGRNSSRSPNLQNIPRDPLIRNCFAAPPGWRLMEADFSQIELRVMLSLCEEPRAVEGYRQGIDAHAITAMSITGKDTWTKGERQDAKPVNFALLYGGDWWTLQSYARNTYGVHYSDNDAKRYAETFFNDTWPRLKPYHDEIIDRLHAPPAGTIQTPIGHRWRYKTYDRALRRARFEDDSGELEHLERAAINSHGQGTAAYMTNLTGIYLQHHLRRRGLQGQALVINTVHDSLMLQYRPEIEDELVEAALEAAAKVEEWCAWWYLVPLVLDFEVGQKWGNLAER